MCGKKVFILNLASLHEIGKTGNFHILCFNCLRSYVSQISKGKIYRYCSSNELVNYPCPFFGCKEKFTHELVGKIFPDRDNIYLLKNARSEFMKSLNIKERPEDKKAIAQNPL